jgi:hypothetical protein
MVGTSHMSYIQHLLELETRPSFYSVIQWKGSNRKQSARWQHVSWLKASASVMGKINYGGLKHNSLYLGLVLPSGG